MPYPPTHPEPIRSSTNLQTAPTRQQLTPRSNPINVEQLIAQVAREFPAAHLRITGRGRSVRRQAELMAARLKANRQQFLRTYRPAPHITAMDDWGSAHPDASIAETSAAFEQIISAALQLGAVVSNHLTDRSRDIGIPSGGRSTQRLVKLRLQELGAHVIDERDAVGGPHWHVDY